MNRIEEIDARLAAIPEEMEKKGKDMEALTAIHNEVKNLKEERAKLVKEAEERQAILDDISTGKAGSVVRHGDPEPDKRTYSADSPEYRSAYLKNLMGRELTAEERAAFTHTTTTTGAVMPTTMINRIWSLIGEEHPILGDVTVYRTGTVIDVVKHTAIAAGDAASVNEDTAATDEKNTFVKVTLSGKDFSKTVKLSYALGAMALDAFEAYLVNEIADRLGAAIAADIVAQIGTDMTAGNKVTSATAKKTTYTELAEAFAKLQRANAPVVYAKRSTVFKYLVTLSDTAGRPIFQPNAQDGAMGMLIGAQVKYDDAVADDVLLIGDPKKYVENMVQDIMIETDRDIEKHNHIYSGYARASGTLIDPDSFVQLTVKQA